MQNNDPKTIQKRLKKERSFLDRFPFFKDKDNIAKFNKSKILHNIVLKSSKFYDIFD